MMQGFKQALGAYLFILALQTIQYSECFVWGIQEYSRNNSVSEIVRGLLAGFIEYSDNYLMIGEQIQSAARFVMLVMFGG